MTEILEVPTEPVKTAQTEAPATEPTGWMSPTGEIRDGAPESVANIVKNKGWTTVEQIVEGFTGLEKFKGIGEHFIIPEAEDAEGWDKVYKQLGRPDTHDKYELNYAGDVQISDELTGQFKQFAHKLGLTQSQFDKIVNFQLEAVSAQSEAYDVQLESQKEANIAALKQKFGEANYGAKITGARIIADSLGIYNTLEAKGLASDPAIIEMLDMINSRTAEDVITPQSPATSQKTPQAELEEIKKSEAFTKKFDPKHKETMARYMELCQQVANAGQSSQPRI